MGLLLVTDFDEPMTPYLDYFYQNRGLRFAFSLLYCIAEQAPASPKTDAVFEQYLSAHNLSTTESISFAYNASVAQIIAAFPPTAGTSHANPLTLWMPVTQDPAGQRKVTELLSAHKGGLITDGANLIHYSRSVGIPNRIGGVLGILVVTEFDGLMDAFLEYFYTRTDTQKLFAALYDIALTPPLFPNNKNNFKQYVIANSLATTRILYAYGATVAEIVARFPPTP